MQTELYPIIYKTATSKFVCHTIVKAVLNFDLN